MNENTENNVVLASEDYRKEIRARALSEFAVPDDSEILSRMFDDISHVDVGQTPS